MLDEKILVLIACSKKKLPDSAPAKEFNRGQLFQTIRKLASQNNFDLRIVSGLLGLLAPDDIVSPYDHKLQDNKEDLERVKALTIPKLLPLIPHYDIILVILGKTYLKVIQPIINDKFIIIFDKRGLFGYLSTVSKWLKMTKDQLLREVREVKNPSLPLPQITLEGWIYEINNNSGGEKMNEKVQTENIPKDCISSNGCLCRDPTTKICSNTEQKMDDDNYCSFDIEQNRIIYVK